MLYSLDIIPEVNQFELLLLVISFAGVFVTLVNELNALRTADWLVNTRLNGPRRIAVFGGVIRNGLYLTVQVVFLIAAVIQVVLHNLGSDTATSEQNMLPILRVIGQGLLVLASEISRRERTVLLTAIDDEEEHLLRTGMIPAGASTGVATAAARVASEIARGVTAYGDKAIDPLQDGEAALDRAPTIDTSNEAKH